MTIAMLAVSPGWTSAVAAAETSTDAQPTTAELLRMIRERDALIVDLRRRVEALERQGAPPASGASRPPQSAAAEPASSTTRDSRNERPPAPTNERTGARKSAATTPGQFDVDEEAAERALERALVITGALLLPVGQVDIQPAFTYIHSEDDAPTVFTAQGSQLIASHRIRRDVFSSELFLRLGLPFDTQLEVGIPYRYVRQQSVTEVGFSARADTDAHASGLGDVSLGLAKGLLRERGWWPDLIGRVTWDTSWGKNSDHGVSLGGGFNELQTSLTLTKRQDPLVFVGSASYTTTLEKDNLKPGDQLGLSVGVLLAASPDTSLRAVLNQTFADKLKIGDRAIGGSDRVVATLNFGASSIIGHGKFLDLTAGVGLTDSAPDYSLGLSFSFRFGLLKSGLLGAGTQ
ncbi:MAG TPA: transporter [Burkholderiales bacterium]|nr:transporter [Burkholderiales bacterium]